LTGYLGVLAVAIGVLLWPKAALAQQADGGESGQAAPGAEVSLQVPRVGVSGKPRPGDWAAFEVNINDHGDTIRTVLVRLEIPDPDEDRLLTQRAITTKQNTALKVWLYARIPFGFEGRNLTVSAFEAKERPGDDPTKTVYDAGRELGSASFRINNTVSTYSGLIGVVGRRDAGLEQYSLRFGNEPFAPTGHEVTEIVGGIQPADIPDRVMGLMPLEALVWTGSGADEQPSRLSESQADSIREWVMRGGQLIIPLPVVGQTWIGSSNNPLADIMPAVDAARTEGVDLGAYRYMFTGDDKAAFPSAAIVHFFSPTSGAGPTDAMPILASPEGKTVVVRRLVGTGTVTLIGIDVATLAQGSRIVRADYFWHRILGKRLELPSIAELNARKNNATGAYMYAHREDSRFEDLIADDIEKHGRAAGGLLMALLVFGSFWLCAGPIGFYGLKRARKVHYSWLGFVAVIGAFTAIAWGGANLLRQRTADGQHITFLDHVYGQPVQRATAWMNIYFPSYGEQRVTVGSDSPGGSGAKIHQMISPWDPPHSETVWKGFPDAREYTADARNPDSISFPARATVKQVQLDWAGSPRWKMPLPQLPANAGPQDVGREIRLEPRKPDKPGDRDWTLVGSVTHGLPGPLEEVVIVVVRRQTPLYKSLPGSLLAEAHIYKLSGPWKPGDPLNFESTISAANPEEKLTAEKYLAQLLPSNPRSYVNPIGTRITGSTENSLTALSLFSLLDPPEPTNPQDSHTLARRELTHTWDVTRWFTQPCVIIIGQLKDQETPIPVTVDGQPLATRGRTVVRWVYPLHPDPPRFRPPAPADTEPPTPGPVPDPNG
jgi:hypothetical protein